jgi:TRAP-type C4-dicarboxylate transport system substrate-binding protein
MRKLLTIMVVALVILGIILTGCAGQTTAPATTKPAATSAAPTTAAPTTAAPKPTAAPTTSAPAATQPIVWRAATFLPRNMFSVRNMVPIADKLKTRSNGQFTIQYLGGPEVVPAMQLAEAVRRDVIQMAFVPASYYTGLVPLGSMLELSELLPAEERAVGAYDYLNELHSKVGLYFLERPTGVSPVGYFTMLTKQLITSPKDLANKKIGATSNNVQPFLNALGGAAPIIPAPDVYTAVERGVVDGFSYPITNSVDSQLQSLVKYAIDHPYFNAGASIICNLDQWNKLPKEMQTLLTNIASETVVEYMKAYDEEVIVARKKCTDAGVKFIKFSDADAAYWYKTCTDSCWAEMMKQYPEVAPKYKALVTKKK